MVQNALQVFIVTFVVAAAQAGYFVSPAPSFSTNRALRGRLGGLGGGHKAPYSAALNPAPLRHPAAAVAAAAGAGATPLVAPLTIAANPSLAARPPIPAEAPARGGAYDPEVADPYYDPNSEYNFNYKSDDAVNGDAKNLPETRAEGGKGGYNVMEPGGALRTADYGADPVNGYNAPVNRPEGGTAPIHPAPAMAYSAGSVANPMARLNGGGRALYRAHDPGLKAAYHAKFKY